MRKIIIDKDVLVAEIEKRIKETESMQPKFDQFWAGQISAFKGILKIIDTFETKEVNFPYHKNRDKELALSLQIQAYLNTASDELYAQGKPLYSKLHLEGIHECMKMWVKLHNYYFYKNTCENKEVDLEKEYKEFIDCDNGRSMFETAKHFFELGIKSKEEKVMTQEEKANDKIQD